MKIVEKVLLGNGITSIKGEGGSLGGGGRQFGGNLSAGIRHLEVLKKRILLREASHEKNGGLRGH